jgi:hypothetical protein
VYKIYYQKTKGEWQLAHVYKGSVKGKIQASQAKTRMERRGYKVRIVK